MSFISWNILSVKRMHTCLYCFNFEWIKPLKEAGGHVGAQMACHFNVKLLATMQPLTSIIDNLKLHIKKLVSLKDQNLVLKCIYIQYNGVVLGNITFESHKYIYFPKVLTRSRSMKGIRCNLFHLNPHGVLLVYFTTLVYFINK